MVPKNYEEAINSQEKAKWKKAMDCEIESMKKNKVCVGNTCCDTTIECDGFECGTGICGGDCPNTCDATEVCEGNTCVCDVAIECDGFECGTGVCGGDCTNSCASFEICDVNACICDVAIECDGFECGTGVCGGDCPNTCASNELCSENTCVCDISKECNGFECGTGLCGGECPNTCASNYICYENNCVCPDGFTLFAGNCINCPATFENCFDCTLTACTNCSDNYHLENGQCVYDTVFGYNNFSQYNFVEESSNSDSYDSSEPSIVAIPDFFFSPNSNNFKEVDNDLSIENCCDILSTCLLMLTIILFII